ncbi:MAG: hypothetical protein FIA96_05700 [Betaproteobacteria bacterium]|nr:hypothetical protein [Betaproteobacteria bacterium]
MTIMNKSGAAPASILPRGQRGSVLMLSVIMLMALTLLAISAIKMGMINLRAVNNLQTREEAVAAADSALSSVLSTSLTTATGEPVAAQTLTVSGVDVQVAQPCIRTTASIANNELPQVFPTYVAECQSGKAVSEQATFCRCLSKSEYRANDTSVSNCYRMTWEVVATVQNNWFGANVSVTQGVTTNVSSSGYYTVISKALNFCS